MSIFENCLIQAPDGVVLSRCGMKKVEWYVKHGLAEIIETDPVTTIRLKFEPSGRRGLGDPLLLDGKPNICVACGTPDDLTKHHIVPYSFIKYMKIEYKVDIIRDIFPLCQPCHGDYEKNSQEKRKEIYHLPPTTYYPLYNIIIKLIVKFNKNSINLPKE